MNNKETIELHGTFVQSPLLPATFKLVGAAITAAGVAAAILLYLEIQFLTPWLLSIGWKCLLVTGVATIAMSREAKEDEVIATLRLEVFQWAIWLLCLISIVNIVISDDNPIEAYKVLIVVLGGAVVLFRLRLRAFERRR